MDRTDNAIFLDNDVTITNLMPFKYDEGVDIIISRDNILSTVEKINKIINKAKWIFQVDDTKLDLGAPFTKLSLSTFKLNDKFSIKDVFDYWEINSIHIDCLMALNILLLYYIKDYVFFDNLEQMRCCFNINLNCGLMNAGIHKKIKSKLNLSFPLCDLDTQDKLVQFIPPGCYLYIRGSIGWYDWVYNDSIQDKNTLNTVLCLFCIFFLRKRYTVFLEKVIKIIHHIIRKSNKNDTSYFLEKVIKMLELWRLSGLL